MVPGPPLYSCFRRNCPGRENQEEFAQQISPLWVPHSGIAYMEEKAFGPGCQGPSSPGLSLRVSPEFLHFLNVPLMTLQRATSGMPPSAWRADTHQQFPEIPDCTSASVCIFPPLNVNLPRTKTIPYSQCLSLDSPRSRPWEEDSRASRLFRGDPRKL